MINFMQTNQYKDIQINIIDNNIWQELYIKLCNKDNLDILNEFIQNISIKYNIDKKNIIKSFINYIIRVHPEKLNTQFLNFIENIMHYQDCKSSHYISYILSKLSIEIL